MKIDKNSTLNLSLLLAVSTIWGAQFVFNKFALFSFTPIEIAFYRSIIGALTLSFVWLCVTKKYKENSFVIEKKIKLHALLFGIAFFEATLPFLLIPWGQQRIDSSIAAILIGTIPIFVVLINLLLVKKSNWKELLSITVGFSGIMILLLPGTSNINFLAHIWGELAVLAGACSFAISLFLIRKLPPISEIVSSQRILSWAAVQIMPFLLLQSPHAPLPQTMTALGALVILGVFCAGIVYVFYVMLVKRAGIVFTSFSNYLVPLIGFLLGLFLFKEPVQFNFIVALFLILSALFLGGRCTS
jgi:drug/metabolite transporter (DMT)-like permease